MKRLKFHLILYDNGECRSDLLTFEILVHLGWLDFLTQDIAIDLGTANTLIIHNDKVVVDEPSIVAVDRKSGKVIAIGKQALMMHGESPNNRRCSASRSAAPRQANAPP